jgi:hypothetical protein
MKYVAAGTPTIVFGGEEYGTGSSRDWAAKGTQLLGVRAVVALYGCYDLEFVWSIRSATDSLNSDVKCSLECLINGDDEDVFNIHFNDLNNVMWMAQISFVPDLVGDEHALKVLMQTTDEWDNLAAALSKMDIDDEEDDDYDEPEPIMISMDEKGNFKDCIDLFVDHDSSAGGGTPLYGPADDETCDTYDSIGAPPLAVD